MVISFFQVQRQRLKEVGVRSEFLDQEFNEVQERNCAFHGE